jgi:hypothetical protein
MNQNIKEEDCPCFECLCIPVCRHRTLPEILSICEPVSQYYFHRNPLATVKPTEESEYKRHIMAQILKTSCYW